MQEFNDMFFWMLYLASKIARIEHDSHSPIETIEGVTIWNPDPIIEGTMKLEKLTKDSLSFSFRRVLVWTGNPRWMVFEEV